MSQPGNPEWWFATNGENWLKGVPGDEANPPRLPDHDIVTFLRTVPAARESYNRLYPHLLPEEQARLDTLYNAFKFQMPDYKTELDYIQRRHNVAGVRRMGPGPVPPGYPLWKLP